VIGLAKLCKSSVINTKVLMDQTMIETLEVFFSFDSCLYAPLILKKKYKKETIMNRPMRKAKSCTARLKSCSQTVSVLSFKMIKYSVHVNTEIRNR